MCQCNPEKYSSVPLPTECYICGKVNCEGHLKGSVALERPKEVPVEYPEFPHSHQWVTVRNLHKRVEGDRVQGEGVSFVSYSDKYGVLLRCTECPERRELWE